MWILVGTVVLVLVVLWLLANLAAYTWGRFGGN